METPTRTRSNNRGAVTDVGDSTVAPSRQPATAHASPPARDDRLKKRARTAPHTPGHIAHNQRKTRAHDRQLRAVCKP